MDKGANETGRGRAEKPTGGVLQLGGPLILSFWLRDAMQLVDLPYASLLDEQSGVPGLGEASVAAIGLTQPFGLLLIACWVGASNGLTSRLSAALGRGEGRSIEELKRAARRIINALSAFFVVLGVGIYLAAHLGYLDRSPDFDAAGLAPAGGLDPLVAQQFGTYAGIFLIGRGVTSFWSVLPDSVVKMHHDTKSTMWAGMISGVLNVILNSLFVLVFEWGIGGIASATALASLGGLLYALHRARKLEVERMSEAVDDEPGRFERPVRAILSISVPAAITFILMAAESMAINGMLAGSSTPTPALAAWATFDRALRFMLMPMIAMGVAMLPLSARLYGQRDFAQIRRELRTALGFGGAYLILFVTPLVLLLGSTFADAFFDEERAREYLRIGVILLPVAVLVSGPMFVMRSTFEGMQRPTPGLILSTVRAVCLVIPLAWLGLHFAAELGWEEISGIYAGVLGGVSLATIAMAVWLVAALRLSESEA